MRTTAKLVTILIAILFALGAAELFYRMALPVDTKAEYEGLLNRDSKRSKHFSSSRFQPKRAHPYIGYVYNDQLVDGINSDGFRELTELPYKHDKDEFVIGVFGGSFASDFAEAQEFKERDNEPGFAEELKKLAPEKFKDKKISVLNFALSSGRQPQQYIALSLYLDSLDMAMIIDGFNESYRNRDLDFPVYYPDYSKFFYSKDRAPQYYWLITQQLRLRQRALTETLLDTPVLNTSQLVYYLWRGYSAYLDNKIERITKDERPTFKFPEDIPREEYNRHKADLWVKYTRLQNHLLRGENLPFLHVLQPNQYVPNSKTFSEEEKQNALWDNDPNVQSAVATYAMIIEESKTLNQSGYPVVDLTGIFKDHPETIYRDKCCHINPHGMRILESALAHETVKALK